MNHTEAFVQHGPRRGAFGTWPLPSGEVTIEVEACGLCQRDTAIWSGDIPRTWPVVAGHEVVGRIVECPDNLGWSVGTRVAGMGNQALARHMRVPAWQVAPVHGSGPHLTLVEPLACAINACRQDTSAPTGSAVVFGLGLLGQLVAALLTAEGRHVIGVDTDEERLALAERQGINVARPTAPEIADVLRVASVGFECTGNEQVLWRLSTSLPPGAALILVAHHRHGRLRGATLLDQWHQRGLDIRNAVPWTATDLAGCITAAAALPVDLRRYPLRIFAFAKAADALETWPTGAVTRHVVSIEEDTEPWTS